MFTFLLVIQALVAAALVGVILVQRSEGGGLGMGGSPSGLMSARGAADFLTRSTTILATIFIVLSIALAAYATVARGPRQIDGSLATQPGQTPGGTFLPGTPAPADPLAAAAAAAGGVGNSVAPAAPAPAPVAAEPVATPAPVAREKAPAAAAPAPVAREKAPAAREKAPAAPAASSSATIPMVTSAPKIAPAAPANAPAAGNGQ